MQIVIGLGNPGDEYAHTRHNIGWMVLDAVVAEQGANWSREKKFNAEVARVRGTQDMLLVKPQTFMNNSGEAVRAICDFYKVEADAVTLVYDDKDLPFGILRVRTDGGSAGHNGVKSVIQHLGTPEFHRVRIGVAPADGSPIFDTAKFVLQQFTAEEEANLPKVLSAAIPLITQRDHGDVTV